MSSAAERPIAHTDGKLSRHLDVLLASLVVAAGSIALAQSWSRWLDPIVDIGRDLYIPEQLLHGARLYRDIRYYYPPLVPYLLASVTHFTGASLAAYAAIGIAQSVAIAVLLWLIARRVAGRWLAFGITFAFVSINMCGASTYGANFIFPYSHPATIGMLFFVAFAAAVVFDYQWISVSFAVLASWCKIDYGFAVVVVIAALLVVKKVAWRHLAGYVAAMVAIALGAVAFFGADPLMENVFPPSLLGTPRAGRFYSLVSGAIGWRTIVGEAVGGVVAILVIELLLRRNRKLGIVLAALVGAFLPVTTLFRGAGVLQWGTLLRRRDVWLFVLGVISIAATIRIVFNVAPVWYGFVLTVPLYLLIARYCRGEVVWAALLVVLSLRSLADERSRFALREFPVDTPRGRYFDHNYDRAVVVREVLPLLRGKSLAVFPEGLALAYFANVTTPLSYQTFTPVEAANPSAEAAIVEELSTRPPEQIVILTRDVQEFGSRGFGVDYDQRVVAFIREHYAVVKNWSRPRFDLVLFRRR